MASGFIGNELTHKAIRGCGFDPRALRFESLWQAGALEARFLGSHWWRGFLLSGDWLKSSS
jgi:hypothetical protein